MIVTRLKLANLRAIETAELRFQAGFNLIVGINGVGKTSVLHALGVSLSAVTKQANDLRGRVETFVAEDTRVGTEALTVECGVQIGARDYTYLVHKPRTTSVSQKRKTGMPREQTHETPGRAEFLGDAPSPVSGREPGGRPLAVLFSTSRAVPTERAPARNVAAGGIEAALADAFADRELRLGEFAAWMRVQRSLKKERPAARRALAAFEETVARFLPGYGSLRLAGEDGRQLWIDHGRAAIPVRQLSDGERGILALVLDLTRRLAQANPNLKDPAAKAAAVVLMDEIELHLHPKWQRQIIHNLQAAFPCCQFIATTHSPQVIGEVEHDRIQIIANGRVYSPTHSYGVDSSRLLEEVMEAAPRAKKVQDLLTQISKAIGRQDFARGRKLLAWLAGQIGEDDPEVTRVRILLDFAEGRQ
jgi:predicted ATP-binding protein involved in virulence